MTALEKAIQGVIDAARATLMEQRREFVRGDIEDLDRLEDALSAYDIARAGST